MDPTQADGPDTALDAEPVMLQRVALLVAGGLLLGLDADPVREVVPARPLTPLPTAPACVGGLANHGGRIVTVVDLAAHLGLPSDAPRQRCVLVEHRGRFVGLAVDDVLRIAPLEVDTPGEAGDLPVDDAYLQGAARLDGRVLPVLDADALLRPLFAEDPLSAVTRKE